MADGPFTHQLDVRYGECDQQGVVFNAHYLAYVDDAMDHWMRSLDTGGGAGVGSPWVGTWDVMLKRAVLAWHGPARWPDRLSVRCGVSRWGRTSFDAVFVLAVGDRPVVDVLITYVSVSPADHRPMETPAAVVQAMGPVIPLPPSLVP